MLSYLIPVIKRRSGFRVLVGKFIEPFASYDVHESVDEM